MNVQERSDTFIHAQPPLKDNFFSFFSLRFVSEAETSAAGGTVRYLRAADAPHMK